MNNDSYYNFIIFSSFFKTYLVVFDENKTCCNWSKNILATLKSDEFTLLLGAPKSTLTYSHLSNNHGSWNKRGGWKIFIKSINVEGGFYFVEGEIFQIIR